MRDSNYHKYLNSPQWKAKREAWFSKYGKRCMACGRRDGAMHLHHLTYENFGREHMKDLVSLCPKCHREVEKLHYRMGRRTDRRIVFQAFKAANSKRR